MNVSKTITAALAGCLVAGSAFAADLPSRKSAPVYISPAPVFTWTGFYIGANAGYTWSTNNQITVPTTDTGNGGFTTAQQLALLPYAISAKSSGFIGGVQGGYNWQAGSLVFGLEADIQGVAGAKSNTAFFGAINGNQFISTFQRGLDYLGTVRGRLGFTVAPTFLVYATGGLAYGGTKLGFTSFSPAWAIGSSSSRMSVGWTAGLGGEYAFSPNWSAKIEWLYYDLGSQTSDTAGFAYTALRVPATSTIAVSSRNAGHIVRAGLNYRFNFGGAGPVVAKY